MTDINKYIALRTALLNERAKLEARLGEISKALGQNVSAVASALATTTTTGKRSFSAATKARMALAQKSRWAKLKAKSGAAPAQAAAPAAPKKKRKMSAEGKANIRAAVKARWAKVNALKAKTAK